MTEETIFALALEKHVPQDRSAYLNEACGADAALRQRVEALLQAHEGAGDFLDQPAVAQMAASDGTEAIDAAGKPAETRTGPADPNHSPSLDFLEPARKPDTLGILGHYEILEVIGRGGMGIVLKAFDPKLHRVVAIKSMASELAASATARKRFNREAQAAAAVCHEHVVAVHAVEEDHRPPYLVMQFVDGLSLQQKLDRSGPLELKEILRIGLQIAEGLAAAHKQGLVHRDIKPANILLENGVQRVKITDFGLARAVDDSSLTQSGVIAGTPQYMSPEQAEGLPVDHRTDLFSLGSVIYAMCTGQAPFRGSTTMAVLKRVCEESPRPLREVNPEIPEWLSDIIAKLHAKKPANRFQEAKQVATLLGEHLAHLQQPEISPRPAAVQPLPDSELPNWLRPSAPDYHLIRFGCVYFALSTPIIAIWLLLDLVFHVSDRTNGWICVGLYSLTAIGVCWRYHRTRLTNPETALSYALAGAMGATAFAGLGFQLYFWPRPLSSIGAETVALQVKNTPSPNPGWVELFNGKDLTGWTTHPDQPGDWKVQGGILVGGAGPSNLYTERDDFGDFHLRAEAKINHTGNGGISIRAQIPANIAGRAAADGYEVQIAGPQGDDNATGSLMKFPSKDFARGGWLLQRVVDPPAGEWVKLGVVAQGDRITIQVNDKKVVDLHDQGPTRGRITLQALSGTKVEFRTIEIKELRPTNDREPPGAIVPRHPSGATTLGGGWHDLLPRIDPDKNALRGKWSLKTHESKQSLIVPAGQATHLDVPVIPKGDYEVRATIARTQGDGSFVLLLPVGGKRAAFVLDGWPERGGLTGLGYNAANETLVAIPSKERPGQRLAEGKTYQLMVTVKSLNGQATFGAQLDGQDLLSWIGPVESIHAGSNWLLGDQRRLGLGGWSQFRLDSLELQMLTGDAELVR